MSERSLQGRTLGQYQLIETVGQGGMSTVYRAFQPTLQREVAIKILPESLAYQPDFQARFTREVQVTARLEHPNIVPIYDFGVEENITFIAMRLLTGGTLSHLLQEKKRFDVAPALRLLSEIASALDYAHSNGIIHRDIKPGNIIFDTRGTAYIVDFGIARVLSLRSQNITDTGEIIGTPVYMAPEQFQGLPITGKADQYALAIMAYEMLTGEAPFKGETPIAILVAAMQEDLPKNEYLPQAAYHVLAKAAAKQEDGRYETITDFVRALQAAFDGKTTDIIIDPDYFTVNAPRATITENPTLIPTGVYFPPASVQAQRKSSTLSVALIVGLLLIAIIVFGVIFVSLGNAAEIPSGNASFFLWTVLIGLVGVGLSFAINAGIFQRNRRNAAQQQIPITTVLHQTGSPITQAPAPQPVESKQSPEESKAIFSDQSPTTTFADVKAGDMLGHYEVVKRLDKGNRNRVYHAIDTKMPQKMALAVKTMFSFSADDNRTERFKRETQILSRLHHAHIVPVFDHGAMNDMVYLVMPLLEHGTLSEHIEKSPLPFDEIIMITQQICGAVDYMHSRGILHRDLKGSNIMFGDEQNAYLVDFGIAKIFDDGSSESGMQLTQIGQVVGTPAYMAPEQSMGDDLTPAADLYAIGVLTFQMLTGKLPFEADSPYGLMIQHLRETPPLPSSIRTNIPPAVDDVILKVMDKQPENRYKDGSAFAHALATALRSTQTAGLAQDMPPAHVFISYSRADKEYAYNLAEHLRQQTVPVWIDERIDPSDSWWHTIDKAIEESSAFIVIMSPSAEESRWVHKEILLADKREKPAFPLLLDGECFSIYVDTQYLDVTDGRMPTPAFVKRLTKLMNIG